MSEQVGFIGLGIMGRGMVRNLMKAGFPVRVWNRTSARMLELAADGALPADSPADLAAGSTVIITCVSDTPDVEAVILGPAGVVDGIKAGTLLIDMSTISPQATKAIAATLGGLGVQMLDAPVSGGSEGAAKGTLTIMVGGEDAAVRRAWPIFEAMGKKITHMGAAGAGQMTKLVNQVLVVGHALAMSEALMLAQAGGLDLAKTVEALGAGAAGSWMWNNRGPQIIHRDWRPGFTVDLQQKDVRLCLQAADQLGVPVIATGIIYQLYRSLQADGLGAEGNHALIKALEKLAGFQVGRRPD
jgi:3-hydroxyisobutyrate dehydrogenase